MLFYDIRRDLIRWELSMTIINRVKSNVRDMAYQTKTLPVSMNVPLRDLLKFSEVYLSFFIMSYKHKLCYSCRFGCFLYSASLDLW